MNSISPMVSLGLITSAVAALTVAVLFSCVKLYRRISDVPYLPTISEAALSKPTGALYAFAMTVLGLSILSTAIILTIKRGFKNALPTFIQLIAGLVVAVGFTIQGVYKIDLYKEVDLHKLTAGLAFISMFALICTNCALDVSDYLSGTLSTPRPALCVKLCVIVMGFVIAYLSKSGVFGHVLNLKTFSREPAAQATGGVKVIERNGVAVEVPDGCDVVIRDGQLDLTTLDSDTLRDLSLGAILQYSIVGLGLLFYGAIGFGTSLSVSIL